MDKPKVPAMLRAGQSAAKLMRLNEADTADFLLMLEKTRFRSYL